MSNTGEVFRTYGDERGENKHALGELLLNNEKVIFLCRLYLVSTFRPHSYNDLKTQLTLQSAAAVTADVRLSEKLKHLSGSWLSKKAVLSRYRTP